MTILDRDGHARSLPDRNRQLARPGAKPATHEASGNGDANSAELSASSPRCNVPLPSQAMAMIIDQARDPDHVIGVIAYPSHSLGVDDQIELVSRGLQEQLSALISAPAIPVISDAAALDIDKEPGA